VVAETHGRWGKAMRVRGTTALNRGSDARVNSVSCSAAGECVVGGHYTDGDGSSQAFVESLTNGQWGWAIEGPGTAALNRGQSIGHAGAEVTAVSCVAPAACAAGGYYASGFGSSRAFVVSETHGHWGHAVALPDTVILSTGDARVNSVSCGA